jgi:hypothetical protein
VSGRIITSQGVREQSNTVTSQGVRGHTDSWRGSEGELYNRKRNKEKMNNWTGI